MWQVEATSSKVLQPSKCEEKISYDTKQRNDPDIIISSLISVSSHLYLRTCIAHIPHHYHQKPIRQSVQSVTPAHRDFSAVAFISSMFGSICSLPSLKQPSQHQHKWKNMHSNPTTVITDL
eukprot:COSAG02_NODE_30_length_50867_cov_66.594331_6_plen_121_part_00